jgi:hypothetical protein
LSLKDKCAKTQMVYHTVDKLNTTSLKPIRQIARAVAMTFWSDIGKLLYLCWQEF